MTTDDGTAALFDVDPVEQQPREKLSTDRRRTQRQAEHLATGLHPLSAALRWPIKLHTDAAPADDRQAPGKRCGDCKFRHVINWHRRTYAKCTHGDDWPRATHGAGTDVRAWWPACLDHQPAVTP